VRQGTSPPQEVALTTVDAYLSQDGGAVGPLDAFGHDRDAHVVGEMADGGQRVRVGARRSRSRWLWPCPASRSRALRPPGAGARKAAAGIVHGHPHAPFVDQLDGVAELVIRVELALLGDLDDDLLGRQLGQDLEQGGPVQQAREALTAR